MAAGDGLRVTENAPKQRRAGLKAGFKKNVKGRAHQRAPTEHPTFLKHMFACPSEIVLQSFLSQQELAAVLKKWANRARELETPEVSARNPAPDVASILAPQRFLS